MPDSTRTVDRDVRIILKYEIPEPTDTGRVFLDLPASAVPLSVGLQDGTMVLWALVDPNAETPEHEMPHGPRRLIVCNTGFGVPGFPAGARFLGTLQGRSGIVWHIFDGDAETTA